MSLPYTPEGGGLRRKPGSFERGRAVADAILFEGYALYPYRASSTKNQLRWQFGVLMPGELLETQFLLESGELQGKLRFLRVRRRRIESLAGEPVASVEIGGQLLIPWDEGEIIEHDFTEDCEIKLEGDCSRDLIADQAYVVRTRAPVSLKISVEKTLPRVRVRVENSSQVHGSRDDLLPWASVSTHLLFAGGEFVSLLEPPEPFVAAAAACRNTGVYPVIASEQGKRDLLLASPIILYDHPAVAPESPGDLFDACEIDEILTLRTLLLTDEEKREARATDPRVAALIDRVESLPNEVMSGLHGTFRDRMSPGAKVRLKPGKRGDVQDMFLDGRVATVREVKRALDGRECLAVTVDDDPAAELHLVHGRYHYFYADEVEPLT